MASHPAEFLAREFLGPCRKFLDAPIEHVGHVDGALAVQGDAAGETFGLKKHIFGEIKFARTASGLAPLAPVLIAAGEDLDAVIGGVEHKKLSLLGPESG